MLWTHSWTHSWTRSWTRTRAPATIAAGGIGGVAVDVLLDCGGLPGSAAGASADGGRSDFP